MMTENEEHRAYKSWRDIALTIGTFIAVVGAVILFAAYGLEQNIDAVATAVDNTVVNEMDLSKAASDSWVTYHLWVAILSAAIPFAGWLVAMFILRAFMESARTQCKLAGDTRAAAGTAIMVRNVYIGIAVVVFLSLALVVILLWHVAAYALPAAESGPVGALTGTDNAVYFYQLSLIALIITGVGHLVIIIVTAYLAYKASRMCRREDKSKRAVGQPATPPPMSPELRAFFEAGGTSETAVMLENPGSHAGAHMRPFRLEK